MAATSFGTCTFAHYKSIINIVSHRPHASLLLIEVRSIANSSFGLAVRGGATHIRGLQYEHFAKCEAEVAMATA